MQMALFILTRVFCKNSVYLHVRLRERFVNPQLLKQLAFYKIKEHFIQKTIHL